MRKAPEGWEWDESVGDIVRKKGTPVKQPNDTIDGRGISEFIKRNVEDPAGVKGKPNIKDYVTKRKPEEPQKMWEEHPNQREHHTNMAKRGLAERIGKEVPNRDEYIKMQGKIPPNSATSVGGLTDFEKGIIAGGGAAATGAGAKEAHSYWTRKKNGQ
jgi:hypothetical protein